MILIVLLYMAMRYMQEKKKMIEKFDLKRSPMKRPAE